MWEDQVFANTCRATCRRDCVLASMTTDVCLIGLDIIALEESFNLQVVCDARGSDGQIADAMTRRRM